MPQSGEKAAHEARSNVKFYEWNKHWWIGEAVQEVQNPLKSKELILREKSFAYDEWSDLQESSHAPQSQHWSLSLWLPSENLNGLVR